jgi:predicted nucleic acid-binding protein
MVSNVFLDVNILLDFTLKREAYPAARQLIQKVIDAELNAFISPSIIHITGYWLTKAYGSAKAKELLLTLIADIQVIEMNHEVAIHALNSKMTDIEDSLQYYTALAHKLDAFISRDKELKKAAIASLPVYTPEEFLEFTR